MQNVAYIRRPFILGGVAAVAVCCAWLLHVMWEDHALSHTAASTVPLPRAVPVGLAQPIERVAPKRSDAGAEESSANTRPPLGDDDALRAWARQDPAEATRWLATQLPGPRRDVVLEIVCLEVVQFDPAEAIAIADRFGYAGMNLRENLVAQWAEHDVLAAKAYASTLPSGPERDRLFGRVALAWSASDPAAAARWVVAEVSPGVRQEDAAISVIYQWAKRDPDAAERWIQSLAEGELRERALNELKAARQTPP